MIYIPWILFLIGLLWLFRTGSKAKERYLRERNLKEQKGTLSDVLGALKEQRHGQGQVPELNKVIGGFGQTRGATYGTRGNPPS
jgi:hypothetical protein